MVAALIAALDDSVGDLVAVLEKKEATNNTVVIFVSDNGGTGQEVAGSSIPRAASFGSNWPLRGAKQTQ